MNIDLHRRVSPLSGVFAANVIGLTDRTLPGVANIGTRPTIHRDPHCLLEVHLFDFNRSVYGAHVTVEFIERIREECKFDSLDKLRNQIQRDVAAAREILKLKINATRTAS
jgi:riboflavin kinase/FMN adenylyltransferase